MKEHLNKITPQVGDAWRADEVYTKIRGEMKYVFSLMDSETRLKIKSYFPLRENEKEKIIQILELKDFDEFESIFTDTVSDEEWEKTKH